MRESRGDSERQREERKGEHRKCHTGPLDLGELGQVRRTSWRNSVEYVIRLNVVFECTCGQVDVLSM